MAVETLHEDAQTERGASKFTSIFPIIAIPLCFVISHLIFHMVMGDGSNFEGGSSENHPLPGNYMGIVYKGGVIVPILMGMLLMTFTFAIERFITLAAASGKGSVDSLVRSVRMKLRANQIDEAIELCDNQKGSVANVLKATLLRYKQVLGDTALDKEQKLTAISKELEETSSLELPMLEKNLPILATLGSVATLVALLGTVMGMIKAFAGMAQAGAPDATALANGISEALVNTAIGIGTSAIAIIFYNYFTNKIDGMSYNIEEAGMSIAQTFSEKY